MEPQKALATFPKVLFPAVLLLVPIAYLVLSNRRPSGQTRSPKSNTSGVAEMEDYTSQFDTSNIRVTKILVHPIKSGKATSVQEAKYTRAGLENDRKWCIIKADNHHVVTARETGKIVLIHPRIVADSSDPEGGRLEVSFPDDSGCETFSVPLNPVEATLQKWQSVDIDLWEQKGIEGYVCETSTGRSPSTILSEYVGYPVHLLVKGPRIRICQPTPRFPTLDAPSYFQDGYPLLLLSEESVEAIQERIRNMVGVQGVDAKWEQEELTIERFRPNIVFKGAGAPFVEDVITELSLASHKEAGKDSTAIIQLVSKCARCLLPNVDPTSGVRDNAVPYKVIMKFRRGLDPENAGAPCVGCNGILTGEGVVKVGDWVHVRTVGVV